MSKKLELYTAVAERETGLWVSLPIATGRLVSRIEWLELMQQDPHLFQIATLTAEELTNYSSAEEDVIERAVLVMWSDETLQ